MAAPCSCSSLPSFFLLTVGVVAVVRWELQPLRRLANAATGLARNDLAARIPIDPAKRNDELGQLAQAIQRMTLGLGAGLEEIARIVEVSQSVSARANMTQTLPILLRGVLRSVAPGVAGFHLVENAQGAVRSVAREGEMTLPAAVEGSIERLSRQVWRTAAPVVLPQVQAGAAEQQRDALAQSNVRALAIFPMLREGRTIGTLWAAWDAPPRILSDGQELHDSAGQSGRHPDREPPGLPAPRRRSASA